MPAVITWVSVTASEADWPDGHCAANPAAPLPGNTVATPTAHTHRKTEVSAGCVSRINRLFGSTSEPNRVHNRLIDHSFGTFHEQRLDLATGRLAAFPVG